MVFEISFGNLRTQPGSAVCKAMIQSKLQFLSKQKFNAIYDTYSDIKPGNPCAARDTGG